MKVLKLDKDEFKYVDASLSPISYRKKKKVKKVSVDFQH